MSGLERKGFKLLEGKIVTIPQGADQHFQAARSKASVGKILPLVAFLQEAPGNKPEYCFATKNTGGRGLKCFLSKEAKDGTEVEIVMIHTNDLNQKSAAMVPLDQVSAFMDSYNKVSKL